MESASQAAPTMTHTLTPVIGNAAGCGGCPVQSLTGVCGRSRHPVAGSPINVVDGVVDEGSGGVEDVIEVAGGWVDVVDPEPDGKVVVVGTADEDEVVGFCVVVVDVGVVVSGGASVVDVVKAWVVLLVDGVLASV